MKDITYQSTNFQIYNMCYSFVNQDNVLSLLEGK